MLVVAECAEQLELGDGSVGVLLLSPAPVPPAQHAENRLRGAALQRNSVG